MKNCIVVSDLSKKVCGVEASRFVVPIYQRVFAWGSKEVARFLTDLYEHFVKRQFESDYYLGVITVVNGSDVKHKDDLILVDGQQRLTCIMLLGALLGLDLNLDRLVYEARHSDQDALNKIYSYFSKPVDSLLDSGNDTMDAFFRRANELDAGEADTDENKPIKICELRKRKEIIAAHLKLFVSILPKEPYGEKENVKQQNRYFEKMNSGGKQLEPHEILKVGICSKCSDPNAAFATWNMMTDFSRRYDSDSELGAQELCKGEATFENLMFSKASPGDEPAEGGEEFLPSRLGLLELPMFLLHVLANCNEGDRKGVLNEEWRGDKLIEAFHVPEKTREWADKFINVMKSYRQFLDEKIIHLSFDANRNVYDYKFEDDEPDENMRNKKDDDNCMAKLRQFQAMLFVASQGRQGKQKWLLMAYNDSDYMNGNFNTQFMILKGIDKLNATTDQLRTEYVDSLCYSMQSRWLFWRLDYLLWECVMDGCKEFSSGGCTHVFWNGELSEKNIKAIKSFRFHTGRSIEHLHPQTDYGDTEWDEGTPPRKDMFYNLCLLTSSVNSRLSNDSVAVKLARVKELAESGKAGLQSIKMLFMYRECRGLDSDWTPKIAQIHLARMKKVLLDSYLYRKN